MMTGEPKIAGMIASPTPTKQRGSKDIPEKFRTRELEFDSAKISLSERSRAQSPSRSQTQFGAGGSDSEMPENVTVSDANIQETSEDEEDKRRARIDRSNSFVSSGQRRRIQRASFVKK